MPTKGALRFSEQAQFDAPRNCQGLAATLAGSVYGDTPVERVSDGDPCEIFAAGHRVTARTVVLATHAPKLSPSPLLESLTGYLSYTLAFELGLTGFPAGLFWDTDEPYHYLRNVHDQGRDLLLIGGADQPIQTASPAEARFQRLEAYARRNFKLGDVVYRGSGEYFVTVDNLPYIGQLPGTTHVFLGTGYAGTGLTFGSVAGLVLADLLLDRANPYATLYRPSREVPAPGLGGNLALESR